MTGAPLQGLALGLPAPSSVIYIQNLCPTTKGFTETVNTCVVAHCTILGLPLLAIWCAGPLWISSTCAPLHLASYTLYNKATCR